MAPGRTEGAVLLAIARQVLRILGGASGALKEEGLGGLGLRVEGLGFLREKGFQGGVWGFGFRV